ncbi:hypothetical protein D9619_008356 [Psilocybe cf. subviscida]|uniref:AA1-like domain-containing protein n=1 Tax=Psilocybe cf. subviscida TaxID=2480587 RepID=A0A8H5F0Y1_9AGAR|nr:hypothetical protein D9619_008356 [Psilocybe cf. subviscida]
MKNVFSTVASILVAAASASALTIPGASTPAFYLVSSSTTASANLLPLRMATGSGNGDPTLTGTGAPAIFYFYQGQLKVYDVAGGNQNPFRPLINTIQTGAGSCANHGALVFVQGSSTNKCASYNSFQIQSNNQNSQLGAKLVFNFVGGFFSCNNGQQVYYKINVNDGPSGCVPIDLNTVAVP